jgi:hypothetical protein
MSGHHPWASTAYFLMGVLFLLITTVAAARQSAAVLVWLTLGLAFLA